MSLQVFACEKKPGHYQRVTGTIQSEKSHVHAVDSPALNISYKYKDMFCG